MATKLDTCEHCGADWNDKPIPRESLHNYNHGPNGEFLRTFEDYLAVEDQIENPTTHFSRRIGIEYGYDSPHRYDGVSEWLCPDCGHRVNRFTGEQLADDEFATRDGNVKGRNPDAQL